MRRLSCCALEISRRPATWTYPRSGPSEPASGCRTGSVISRYSTAPISTVRTSATPAASAAAAEIGNSLATASEVGSTVPFGERIAHGPSSSNSSVRTPGGMPPAVGSIGSSARVICGAAPRTVAACPNINAPPASCTRASATTRTPASPSLSSSSSSSSSRSSSSSSSSSRSSSSSSSSSLSSSSSSSSSSSYPGGRVGSDSADSLGDGVTPGTELSSGPSDSDGSPEGSGDGNGGSFSSISRRMSVARSRRASSSPASMAREPARALPTPTTAMTETMATSVNPATCRRVRARSASMPPSAGRGERVPLMTPPPQSADSRRHAPS